MYGEGSRSSRFASRNARWTHNQRVNWLADGEASEDLAVFQQQPGLPPHADGHDGNGHNGNGYTNGHNGNGHYSNGHNGNGHSHGGNGHDGNGGKLSVALSEAERERLKGEVVYWGLQQSQQGRMLSEEQLQQEFDRRLRSAEFLLGHLEGDLQQEYDRLRSAEQLLREREERQQQARFAPPEPRPSFRDVRPAYPAERPTYQPERPTYQAEPMREPMPGPPSKPSKVERWMPKQAVSRRNALKLIGLLGTQGDTVHVTLDNSQGRYPHSVHFHSIHPGTQDGVFQIIPAGGKGTYTFTAQPFGVFPYHCHIAPFDQHVARGLYGTLIIDPPTPRPPANEMLSFLNGYDVNFDKGNEIYSMNGLPNYYQDHPISLRVGQLNRVFVVNMTEFDDLNPVDLHANVYSD